MAKIFKRCPCPEDQWKTCPHQWVVRYRTTGGRSSRQRQQSFGDDQREAEDFALKVEHDKRAHVFVDPKAGRALFLAEAETWLVHNSIEVTHQIYGHLVPSSFARARTALDAAYHKNRTQR